MLEGRFGDTSGRPYIEARLEIPRLGIVTDMSFMLDTGADETTLFPDDGERLGVPYAVLNRREIDAVGVGGTAETYEELAFVDFSDGERAIYSYEISLTLLEPHEDLDGIPSLIGRDILNRWDVSYRPVDNKLEIIPRSWDAHYKLK